MSFMTQCDHCGTGGDLGGGLDGEGRHELSTIYFGSLDPDEGALIWSFCFLVYHISFLFIVKRENHYLQSFDE